MSEKFTFKNSNLELRIDDNKICSFFKAFKAIESK